MTGPAPIADYAFIGDCRTGALVSRGGSIDWFCAPRFDASSMFNKLLGTAADGAWTLAPVSSNEPPRRAYDAETFTLVTTWTTATGTAEVTDVLPVRPETGDSVSRCDIIRRVRGIEGEVDFDTSLTLRMDYARAIPWIVQRGSPEEPVLEATAGPDSVLVRGVRYRPNDHTHRGTFTITAGETRDLTLTWFRSYRDRPAAIDVDRVLKETNAWWRDWASHIDCGGQYRDLIVRSLLVLRALTNLDTGGMVAAATTSLPEDFGGERNWDYRYVWLRDAALALEVLSTHGFVDLADHWRTWLLRSVAGDPDQVQIMYGIAGERQLVEVELDSLDGYQGASPVRIGNGAVDQFQADVVGEVMICLDQARKAGLEHTDFAWSLQKGLLRFVEHNWDRKDNGIWEIRGELGYFTHGRAMMWAAFDRAIRAAEEDGLDGPIDHWRALRDKLRTEIDEHGVDPETNAFRQLYGQRDVDGSLLQMASDIGYCAPDDPRMVATVELIEQQLIDGGLVKRYRTDTGMDGLAGDEHPFLVCTFWLIEQYVAMGRLDDAVRLMDRALEAANDVGLFAEEFDPVGHRQAGNTPQALSHLGFVRAADAIVAAQAGTQPRTDAPKRS